MKQSSFYQYQKFVQSLAILFLVLEPLLEPGDSTHSKNTNLGSHPNVWVLSELMVA
jgi:hypothetical protein